MLRNLLLAGLILLLRCALRLIRLPIRALVFLRVIRFLILMGLLQSDPDLTTLPFLGPPVHLTARVIYFQLSPNHSGFK